MGTGLRYRALQIIMMMFFAVLPLNIAVPALVLSVMALAKWVVLHGLSEAEPKGRTA